MSEVKQVRARANTQLVFIVSPSISYQLETGCIALERLLDRETRPYLPLNEIAWWVRHMAEDEITATISPSGISPDAIQAIIERVVAKVEAWVEMRDGLALLREV